MLNFFPGIWSRMIFRSTPDSVLIILTPWKNNKISKKKFKFLSWRARVHTIFNYHRSEIANKYWFRVIQQKNFTQDIFTIFHIFGDFLRKKGDILRVSGILKQFFFTPYVPSPKNHLDFDSQLYISFFFLWLWSLSKTLLISPTVHIVFCLNNTHYTL